MALIGLILIAINSLVVNKIQNHKSEIKQNQLIFGILSSVIGNVSWGMLRTLDEKISEYHVNELWYVGLMGMYAVISNFIVYHSI